MAEVSLSSPASTMTGAKIGRQPGEDSHEALINGGGIVNGFEEEIPYENSEDETEQPHDRRNIKPATRTEPFIRVGKGGSRAQPTTVPLQATSLASSALAPVSPSDVIDRPGQSQWTSKYGNRRVAGGLSGCVAAAPALVSPMVTAMMRKESNRSLDAAFSAGADGSVSGRSIFRPVEGVQRSDLTDWAPRVAPVLQETTIENLPNWNTLKPGDSTSRPISRVEKDMDWSFRRLISENVFQKLLEDPLGRHRFRNFLDSEEGGGGVEILDFYFDLGQYNLQVRHLKEMTEAIHDLYMAEGV